MADLMTEFAQIVTDMRRMEYDNSDPMRHSKRHAVSLAGAILSNAVREAASALDIARHMDVDVKDVPPQGTPS